MSNIADSVKIAQDKDGMLRRALERIIQLYTDKSHFIYELLQNAEDAEAKSILFSQYPDRLEVFHDGKPFTSGNLQGLCDIGKSDKVDNLNQIGEFGVGFKSVFGICDTVRLYSDPSHFRNHVERDVIPFAVEIQDFTRPEDIPEEPLPRAYTTRFVFPYAVGQSFSGFSTVDSLTATVSKKLQNLGITTLLFMKNLEQIEYRIELGEAPITGEYLLDKVEINDHCMLVSAIGTAERSAKTDKSDELISYLMFSKKIPKYAQRTVDIAFPVKQESGAYQCIKAPSPYVSVYFPTETESKLRFIVQGPYRTTPNRSSIPADDADNQYLAEETAILLRDSILELNESGKLNMSFVKSLPLSEDDFYSFDLFEPLLDTVRELFQTAAIVPNKAGGYVYARYAKIARQEKLASLFPDALLSKLINDGNTYSWLPTFLTETNKEYKGVFDFLTDDLDIPLIRPEDLRTYFALNTGFLKEQTDDWLVELYGIFENIPAAFSKSRYETNMTTAKIVKTSTGEFVAPFRREGKNYIPNVFLPSRKIHSTDINFVDEVIYKRCPHFFDDVLQIQKPNEYEFLVKDIERRYDNGHVFDDAQHIDDVKALLKYKKYEEYQDEVTRIIKEILAFRCTDGKMHSTYSARVFLPISLDGIKNEAYYRNLGQNVFFVDIEYYSLHDISAQMLAELGVRESLLVGESITGGTYQTGLRGKQPEWWTTGDYRWKLSIDALKEALKYISSHPSAKDSILKSQAIMRILVNNESRLCGYVHIGGNSVPNLYDEPCEMLHVLRGERILGWDGKWLYTESGELVAPKAVSKHDISTSIYGKIKPDSPIYDILAFKRTEADDVDDLKKAIPREKLEAFFESELRQRFGISLADLSERYGNAVDAEDVEKDQNLPFPTANIKNWEALKKHAAEMLIYADPVRYDYAVRRIRTSSHAKEAKAYLYNMYRHEGTYKYACQLCHETCSNFEATEIFLKPETELDPINLCLCPNCAAVYRKLRADTYLMERLRAILISKKESEIQNGEYVAVAIDDDDELWFTQTHFAEIQELLKLTDEVKNDKSKAGSQAQPTDDEVEQSGLSVYAGYIGKKLSRKDGFVGVVKNVDDHYLYVHVLQGKKAGEDTKIELKFVLTNGGVYSISDM